MGLRYVSMIRYICICCALRYGCASWYI